MSQLVLYSMYFTKNNALYALNAKYKIKKLTICDIFARKNMLFNIKTYLQWRNFGLNEKWGTKPNF